MDVGLVGLALANGILTRETSDNRRIALLQVPEVVQVAVGQDDKAGVLRLRVSPGLLLADQGVLVLGLRLQHDKRKCMAVQQQEVDETVDGFLEVVSVRIEEGPGHLDMVFEDDIGRTVIIIDQSPACLLQELVDLDPCGCFFLHALLVTSLQLLRAYRAQYLEVYHEHAKRPTQATDVGAWIPTCAAERHSHNTDMLVGSAPQKHPSPYTERLGGIGKNARGNDGPGRKTPIRGNDEGTILLTTSLQWRRQWNSMVW